jgi:hypothetical protein
LGQHELALQKQPASGTKSKPDGQQLEAWQLQSER